MKIYLRPIKIEDGPLIVRWRNTPSVAAHCLNKNRITLQSNEEFFHANVETGYYKQYIVERIEEEFGVCTYPIATVYLKDIDYNNKRCELCIFTSDDQEWNTESQTIAIKMLLEKAFSKLGMHKIYTYVIYEFIDEAALLKNVGFKAEAILKDEICDSCGKYQDIIRFSIFK